MNSHYNTAVRTWASLPPEKTPVPFFVKIDGSGKLFEP
jgi:hypothetical protein